MQLEQALLFDLPPQDPKYIFPVAAYESALGSRVCEELRKAAPREYSDGGGIQGFFPNPGAIAYWVYIHFQVNVLVYEDEVRVDSMTEEITVKGESYLMPYWCFVNYMAEAGDPRPTHWPGIPKEARPKGL